MPVALFNRKQRRLANLQFCVLQWGLGLRRECADLSPARVKCYLAVSAVSASPLSVRCPPLLLCVRVRVSWLLCCFSQEARPAACSGCDAECVCVCVCTGSLIKCVCVCVCVACSAGYSCVHTRTRRRSCTSLCAHLYVVLLPYCG